MLVLEADEIRELDALTLSRAQRLARPAGYGVDVVATEGEAPRGLVVNARHFRRSAVGTRSHLDATWILAPVC